MRFASPFRAPIVAGQHSGVSKASPPGATCVHPSADRFRLGANHGRHCNCAFSFRDISRRIHQRPDRLRGRTGHVGHLVAHHHAAANGGSDRGLRDGQPRLWRLESPPCAAVAANPAVRHRRRRWCSARRLSRDLSQSSVPAHRSRRLADRVQYLQSRAADIHADQVQSGSRYRHRRLERIARRSHRPWRSHQHDLGPARRRGQKTRSGRYFSLCCSSP